MTFVFVFSEGIDLSPFSQTPVPASLIPFNSGSAFEFQLRLWKETFPESEIMALDLSEEGKLYPFPEGIETVAIPGAGRTSAAFLLTAISMANDKDPLMILIPGEILFHDHEKYFTLIRSLIKNRMNEYIAFQFEFENDKSADFFYQSAVLMDSHQGRKAFRVNGYLDFAGYLKLKSKNPETRVFPLSGIIMLHTLRFLEYLGHHFPIYNEIILDLSEKIRQKQKIRNEMLRELDKQLPQRLEEFLAGECLIYRVKGGLERIKKIRHCFLFLRCDEDQNYVEGKVKLENTHASIILNKNDSKIYVQNLDSIMLISDGKDTLIRRI